MSTVGPPTLNGLPITHLKLVVPYTGIWHADVLLDRAIDIGGPQVLLFSGTTWNCTAVRALDFTGVRGLRLVGGAAGWQQAIPCMQYASPVGVPTSLVLSDAAALVGELPPVVDPTLAPTVGTAFVRRAGPASLVLNQIAGQQWWMTPAGLVQTSQRPATPIASFFTAESLYGPQGRYVIQTESPGDWMPGAVFVGLTVQGTVSRTTISVDAQTLRVEVLSADTLAAAA